MINGRPRPDLKENRCKDAIDRQKVYDSRTPQQNIGNLDKHDFAAIKERAKLQAKIEKAKEKPVKEKKVD